MLQGIYRIGTDEGAAALWRGWQPALVRQTLYTGLTFVLYEPVRNFIAGDTPKEQIPFYKRVLAGGTAGGAAIFVMNPTDVLKTQMQGHRGERARLMGVWCHGWHPNLVVVELLWKLGATRQCPRQWKSTWPEPLASL